MQLTMFDLQEILDDPKFLYGLFRAQIVSVKSNHEIKNNVLIQLLMQQAVNLQDKKPSTQLDHAIKMMDKISDRELELLGMFYLVQKTEAIRGNVPLTVAWWGAVGLFAQNYIAPSVKDDGKEWLLSMNKLGMIDIDDEVVSPSIEHYLHDLLVEGYPLGVKTSSAERSEVALALRKANAARRGLNPSLDMRDLTIDWLQTNPMDDRYEHILNCFRSIELTSCLTNPKDYIFISEEEEKVYEKYDGETISFPEFSNYLVNYEPQYFHLVNWFGDMREDPDIKNAALTLTPIAEVLGKYVLEEFGNLAYFEAMKGQEALDIISNVEY